MSEKKNYGFRKDYHSVRVHKFFFGSLAGSERDYVIISLVRSLEKDEIDPEPTKTWLQKHLGFLADEHQMNVGLTRARRGLCIIGKKRCYDKQCSERNLICVTIATIKTDRR